MKTIRKLFIHKLVVLIFVFTLFNISEAKAEYYELDISDRSICFADYAKWGRVSVFIISTHFCPPCIALKTRLLQQYEADKTVDIYYCYLSKDNSDKHYQKRESFDIWQQVDVATKVYPTIYLFSSTRNLFSFYQGYSDESYKDLSESMDFLIEKTNEHFKLSLVDSGVLESKNKKLVEDLEAEIEYLSSNLEKVTKELKLKEQELNTMLTQDLANKRKLIVPLTKLEMIGHSITNLKVPENRNVSASIGIDLCSGENSFFRSLPKRLLFWKN
jgi:hypothetical protein